MFVAERLVLLISFYRFDWKLNSG